MEPKTDTRNRVGRRLLLPVYILVGTWVLMWLAQGIPTLCAPVNPCPEPDVRVAPALWFGGLMMIPTAVLGFTWRAGPRLEWVRVVAWVLLVGLAVVGLGAVLFSGGFTLPIMW